MNLLFDEDEKKKQHLLLFYLYTKDSFYCVLKKAMSNKYIPCCLLKIAINANFAVY